MSQITKRALEQSLKNLLREKPLSKITVTDITEDCGVNRMTFYYHFRDIYDLIEWVCVEDAARALEGHAAARAAHIHERILALPRGYDSVIGEDAQLSGGEQQRLSIARAVLLDAPVLVLDEPTAAADAESEAAIQQALSRLAAGRTLLVIAHRLDTVMHADQILVVEGGVIRERGRHAELLALGGRYARLWALGGYESQPSQSLPSTPALAPELPPC